MLEEPVRFVGRIVRGGIGIAKWYEPMVSPAARAPERFAVYIVSAVRVPADARMNAKRFPAAATRDQSIVPW